MQGLPAVGLMNANASMESVQPRFAVEERPCRNLVCTKIGMRLSNEVEKVKYPMHKCRGFDAVPRVEHTRRGLRGALPAPFVRLQSQEWLMGSKPPSTIGTPEHWYVNAFTQGNDLPWNAQTLLACQCASGACPGAHALRSHGSHENRHSILSCNTSVKQVYCFHEQTNNSAAHSARLVSHRVYQGTIRLPIGHRCDTPSDQDSSTAGDIPLPHSNKERPFYPRG